MERYSKLEIEVIPFESEDVITSSPVTGVGDDDNGGEVDD